MLAVALAAIWLVRLPMLQGNDENAHADYVFALYDAGRPYRVARTASAANLMPQLRYLEDATRFDGIRYVRDARVVSGYGNRAFVAALDAHVPPASGALPSASAAAPFVAYAYPEGYYALAALAMGAAHAATGSFTFAYFAARSLGLVLLALSLALAYRVLRLERLGHGLALTLVAAIGVFPMTSWVASYIQPDNLTFALVTLAFACALGWRERPFELRRSLSLGAALAALALVKPVYASAVIVACGALALSRVAVAHRSRRVATALGAATAIALPAAALVAARYATPAGMLRPVLDGSHGTASSHAGGFAAYLFAALADAYGGGISFVRFWGAFGWNDTPLFPPPLFENVAGLLILASLAFATAFAASRVAVARRLLAVARRRGTARAVSLLCGDVLVNTYVAWTAALCAVYAVSGGVVALQGRYWLPVWVATASVSAVATRRCLPPRWRRAFTTAVARGWLAYALVAAPFALIALQQRFYGPGEVAPPANVALVAHADVDGRRYVAPVRVSAASGTRAVAIDGFGVEGGDGSPLRSVVVLVDGAPEPARYGIAVFNANQMRPVGFAATIPADGLAPGIHDVSLRATSPDGTTTVRHAFDLAITSARRGDGTMPRGSGVSARSR